MLYNFFFNGWINIDIMSKSEWEKGSPTPKKVEDGRFYWAGLGCEDESFETHWNEVKVVNDDIYDFLVTRVKPMKDALEAVVKEDGPGLDLSPAGNCHDIAQRGLLAFRGGK